MKTDLTVSWMDPYTSFSKVQDLSHRALSLWGYILPHSHFVVIHTTVIPLLFIKNNSRYFGGGRAEKDYGCLTGGELLPWEDHPSYTDGKYFSEPYGLSRKDMEELEKFCRKYGLTYRIRADFSEWYRRHTLWLEIERKKAEKEVR